MFSDKTVFLYIKGRTAKAKFISTLYSATIWEIPASMLAERFMEGCQAIAL